MDNRADCTSPVKKFFQSCNINQVIQKSLDVQQRKNDIVEEVDLEARLHEMVLKEFECPVCLSYAAPPIMMCIKSHVICIQCWRRCALCPTCRSTRTNTRALYLEKIYELVMFPCTYDDCLFTGKGSEAYIHHRDCDYKPVNCPLRENFKCYWFGPWKKLNDHLAQAHPYNAYYGNSAILLNRKFIQSLENRYVIVLYGEGGIFQVTWEYHKLQRVARIIVKQIGYSETNYKNFMYYVTFFNRRQKFGPKVIMTGSIPVDHSGRVGECRALTTDLVSLASLPEGNLMYKVEIRSTLPRRFRQTRNKRIRRQII